MGGNYVIFLECVLSIFRTFILRKGLLLFKRFRRRDFKTCSIDVVWVDVWWV